jgi:citrate synthase
MGWLTAAQALDALGVRPQTLYANVSRRRIRSKADPKDPRRSLYHEGDVRQLARKRGGPRKAEEVAAGAIEWGDPILPSALSTVAGGRLWYRGEDAAVLSQSKTLEEVAALLWRSGSPIRLCADSTRSGSTIQPRMGSTRSSPRRAQVPTESLTMSALASRGHRAPSCRSESLKRAFLELARRASEDPPSYGRALPVLQAEAAEVLATLADALLGAGAAGALHERVAQDWSRKEASDLLRRALVLLADHELNASTFASRVTVSTGASLAAGVLAGLATLTGPLHGGAAASVWELMEAAQLQGAAEAVRERLAQGRPMAGFGHPLYPAGDPRAVALLAALELSSDYAQVRDAVEEWVGERPNIDFALAALTSTYRLPKEAPLVVFALARSVGWLAHALEQVTTGRLIRPRARYVGPAPAI